MGISTSPFLKIGEAATDPALNAAYQKNLTSYENFLGSVNESGANQSPDWKGYTPDGSGPSPPSHSSVKINGNISGSEPIVLDKKKEKGEVLSKS